MCRSLTALSFIIVLLLCFTGLPSFTGEESCVETMPSVHLSRVCPTYPGEFVSLCNHGEPVDLQGWRLSDGEGSIIFESAFPLGANSVITWCEQPDRFAAMYPGEAFVYRNSSGLLLKGSLKLADQGDEVMLYDAGGSLVDAVHYGRSEPLPPWSGPSLPCKKGEVLVRGALIIGFNSWSTEVPGLFTISTSPSTVFATPILYPQDGLETMVREIDMAESSVQVVAYIMENWTLARHLRTAAMRGLQVTLLLEGQPVGGITDNGAALAYYLQDGGVDVKVMRSSDTFRRYDYLHAKYLVFDERRLLVSSENMADSSFGSNRGWGVLVESEELAMSALDVYRRDLAGEGVDVFPLELSVPRREGGPGRLLQYDHCIPHTQVQAIASLATSPFGIQDVLVYALENAQERVCLQQMRIEEKWLEGDEVMDALFHAAECGVTIRIQLDSGQGTEVSNRRVAASLNSRASQAGWDLECRMAGDASMFTRLHNKGVIVDDTVLVGSANWVDSSMLSNREMVMVLRSPELADRFARWFDEDWQGDPLPPLISLSWYYQEVHKGGLLVLDATACSDPSGIAEFTWDLNGDGDPDLLGPLHVLTLPSGEHNVTLTVTDTLGNSASETVTVLVKGGEGALSLLLYLPIIIFGMLLLMRSRRRI